MSEVSTVVTAKAIFVFEEGPDKIMDVQQDMRIRGIRNDKGMRPINFKLEYNEVFKFETLLKEQWFRSLIINEILPCMKQGYTYKYCDRSIGTPLTIKGNHE